jgi:hypothetical protein
MGKNLLGGGNELDALRITSPPQSVSLVKSAVAFTHVMVNNYGLFVPAPGSYDGTQIRYRSARDPGNAIANNEFLLARGGIAPMPASGQWWVNANTNIAAGTYNGILYDFPSLEAMLAMMQALQVVNANSRLMSAATGIVINASTQIIAANGNRNILFVANTGTTNGTTATASDTDAYLSWGAAAVVGNGIFLGRGQSLIFDTTSGITTQALFGISNNGAIQIAVQEGV